MTRNREKDYDELAKELESEYHDLVTALASLKEYQQQIYKTISKNREQMGKLRAGRSNRVANEPTPPMPAVPRVRNVGGGPVVPQQQQQQQQQQQTTVRPVASTATPTTTVRPAASTATQTTTMTPQVQMPKNSELLVATGTGDIKVPTLKLQPVSVDFIKKLIASKMQATTNKQQADSTSTQIPKRKADNITGIKIGNQITITRLPATAKKVKLNPTNIVSNNCISILPKPTTTTDFKIVEVTGSVKMDDTVSQAIEQDDLDIEILEEFPSDRQAKAAENDKSENNANNRIEVKTEATATTV